MPQADAIAPIANIRPRYFRSRLSSSPMGAASYATGAAEGTAGARRLGGVREPVVHRGGRQAPAGHAGPEGGGRQALVAAERLGELRRLAVPHAVRDLAHGQAAVGEQLGGPLHPHTGEVLAERGPADLGVRALELAARGRDPARDVVEEDVGGEVLLDDRDRVVEQ